MSLDDPVIITCAKLDRNQRPAISYTPLRYGTEPRAMLGAPR
jgi:hypothetical protein